MPLVRQEDGSTKYVPPKGYEGSPIFNLFRQARPSQSFAPSTTAVAEPGPKPEGDRVQDFLTKLAVALTATHQPGATPNAREIAQSIQMDLLMMDTPQEMVSYLMELRQQGQLTDSVIAELDRLELFPPEVARALKGGQ
jgi:hypothetical protein